ncbi:epimerase [soil metagenome]
MDILIFGATGMVGQSVLRECLDAPDVGRVVCVGRSPTGISHPRLADVTTPDLTDLRAVKDRLTPFDACFFCLGVSSVGMDEATYTKVSYDLTMSVARSLVEINPALTFTYVTGAGTDSTEAGKTMWARVKGKTENDLLKLPFKGAYMFRPGIIQPLHSVRSKTALYRVAYQIATPIFALLKRFSPGSLVTSVEVGRAMLSVAKDGYVRPILEVADIQAAAAKRSKAAMS